LYILNDFSKCSKYGLEDDTVDFIGHALALHLDDSYLDKPAKDFVDRVKVLIRKLSLYAFVE
jgi:Rab GDP dissociation inhibitor